jgi:hypothetical protein
MPKKIWSKERIVAELIQTRLEGSKVDPRLRGAARMHFGGMLAALKEAGLFHGKVPRDYGRWSKDSVVKAIQERHREGKSLEHFCRDDRTLYSAAKRLFGNWSKARAAAGFPRPPREFYTPDEVLMIIIEMYERELPLTLRTQNDLKLSRSVIKHFGTWRRAVESLGLGSELRRQWTDQAVLDAILHRRAAGLSLYNTCREDNALFVAAFNRFGSWLNALQAVGIDGRVRQQWSKEKVIERLRQIAKSSPDQSIRQIDSKVTSAAEHRFGSLRNALKAAGIKSNPRKQKKVRHAR